MPPCSASAPIAAAAERLGELVDFDARAAEDDRRASALPCRARARASPACAALRRRTRPARTRGVFAGRASLARDRDRDGLAQVAAGDRRESRGGIVAEKSAVCRSVGRASRIASRSSAKPMSSISSASSSTTMLNGVELSVRAGCGRARAPAWRRRRRRRA